MLRKSLTFAGLTLCCLALAACGGPKSQMQGKYTGLQGSTLEITGDKLIFGAGPMSQTFTYTVTGTDGNVVSLDAVSTDDKTVKIQPKITVDKDAISVKDGVLMDGRWQRS